jgi:site-specific DNA recombinase
VSRTKNPASDPKSAVAYIRVSTSDQRNGIEAQREAIERWASLQCVRIAVWCCDSGVSGAASLEDRPGLLDALGALKAHRAGLLVTAKRDRLARDVGSAAAVERLVREASALIATADGLDNSDSPEGQLVRAIIDSMAQYERALIRARTTAALRIKKSNGERVGSIPLGFLADEQGKLVPCLAEQAAMQRMRELAAAGCSQRAICRALTAEGYLPRKSKWNVTTVSRALRRVA